MAKDTVMSLVDGLPTGKTTSDNIEDWPYVGTLAVNDAVYVVADGTVARASAKDATQECVGLVFEILDSTHCRVLTHGVIGNFGVKMVYRTWHYLSVISGTLTTLKPSGTGNEVQPVGFAVNSTDLFVRIRKGERQVSIARERSQRVWSDGWTFQSGTGSSEVVCIHASGNLLHVLANSADEPVWVGITIGADGLIHAGGLASINRESTQGAIVPGTRLYLSDSIAGAVTGGPTKHWQVPIGFCYEQSGEGSTTVNVLTQIGVAKK